MSQIVVQGLTFSYDTAYDIIFEQVNFQIDTDWKLGFIGRNGRGKTTFLKLLMGDYEYRGNIIASVHFDYFPFLVEDSGKNAVDVARELIAPFKEWDQEMEACLNRGSEKDLERYSELLECYQERDGYVIEELIKRESGILGVGENVLSQPFCTLSYGEQTKIMLAALFLKKNNFLLIDEPTNHLDREGRELLADYLKTKKGFILVSHDRAFLDHSIDHVLYINKMDIEVQKGNYSTWQQNKERKEQFEYERNEQLKKEIGRLTLAAGRTQSWSNQIEASKIGNHSADRGFIGHKSAKMMKRAKSIEQRQLDSIDEKKDLLTNVEKASALKMNLLPFPKERFALFDEVSAYYETNTVFGPLSLELRKGDRIGIQGSNGCGKSTLLKLFLSKKIQYSGNIQMASGLQISYVSQDTSWLFGYLKDFAWKHELNETIFKTVLDQMGFSRDQFEKKMEEFSGGQKKKVLIAGSLAKPAHLFIWDEPLNYIDVISRIQIENLVLEYQPTMIFVEHDKVFSEKVGTKIIQL